MKRSFVICCLLLYLPSYSFSKELVNIDSLYDVGVKNAIRKAHQFADIPIMPVANLNANKRKTYKKGKSYKGMIYSSTKEINTYVGQDVSIYTFMTALHNPRSVLYTERIDLPPYHGVNCMAYYGTVCSGLINYALGFKITQRSYDILVSDYFELIQDQSASGIKLADLVCREGHPALVTGIEKNRWGRIKKIEICSARTTGCRKIIKRKRSFNRWVRRKKLQIYRYKDIYKNVSYTPYPEFVAVDGETKVPFKYNDYVCANKGDKSCYVTGEDVIINVLKKGEKLEIYKDSLLYKQIAINNSDIVLSNLPYGYYQACVVSDNKRSDYTSWSVIDVNVYIDREKDIILFNSANATPVYYEICNVSGRRLTNERRVYAAEFTETEINNGYVSVQAPRKNAEGKYGYTYVKVHFECDYGMVINKPINWFE